MKRDKSEAIEMLRGWLRPGDEVFCILRKVSRSGMTRSIDLYVYRGNGRSGEPIYLSGLAAEACGLPVDRTNGGVKIGGCGMDMGFALVYQLSHTIFADRKRYRGKRPLTREAMSGRRGTPYRWNHETQRYEWPQDRGYWLSHRWQG